MTGNPLLVIEDMPFCLGAMPEPANPGGLPDVYPFRAVVNRELSRLEQVDGSSLNDLLEKAYRVGAEMGTPSDNTDLGRPYVDDFTRFIDRFAKKKAVSWKLERGRGF